MYSKKEEWFMISTLLFSFFSSNYIIKLYIENYTLFCIVSLLTLNVIGASIVIFMENYKSRQIEKEEMKFPRN
jgi:hypothetical protein